jgi:hypothetical protein
MGSPFRYGLCGPEQGMERGAEKRQVGGKGCLSRRRVVMEPPDQIQGKSRDQNSCPLGNVETLIWGFDICTE